MLYLRVKAIRQLGALVLLLVSCLAPAMACMVPDAQMSTEERACCRIMRNQCGQMDMPASHGCCQKTAQFSVHGNALDTKVLAFHPLVPVIWLAATDLINPTSTVIGRPEHTGYSPPKSPPATIFILRI